MLQIFCAANFINERTYIYNQIFKEFFGIEISISFTENMSDIIQISYNNKTMFVSDKFFSMNNNHWLNLESLPKLPLQEGLVELFSIKSYIPIIYGGFFENNNLIKINENNLSLGLDIFGSAFFLMTCYEEYVSIKRDMFDRFLHSYSIFQNNTYLTKPIINEYIEILWVAINYLWPDFKRKKMTFQKHISHDVDHPWEYTNKSAIYLAKRTAAEIVKRRNYKKSISYLKNWIEVKSNKSEDSFFNFDRIMKISEANSLKSVFFFKTACTNKKYDENYSIENEAIRKLLRNIYQRGHEIGLHPSFETYTNLNQTKSEFERLMNICQFENIKQDKWGSRQHFLRFKNPITWRNLEKVGLNYDSSLSYPDFAGFRCGICFDFYVYDLEIRKQLDIIERPLIIMDKSVFGTEYMGFTDCAEAFNYVMGLKKEVHKNNGNFTILWHNSNLESCEKWDFYQSIIQN